MNKSILLLAILLVLSFLTSAQEKQPNKDSIKNKVVSGKTITISGVLQPRYTVSLTPGVDVNGAHFDSAAKAINNNFSLRRVRFQVKAQLNEHFEAGILVNFAEFAGNPTGKVLENAFVKYNMNRHFHLMAGQFRPFIGIEDVIPADLIRSVDFTNGYYSFGKNGWQSFQAGVAVFGDISKKLRYYAGVHNGNSRNQATDNDNRKHVYGRLEADIAKNITLGANAGYGSFKNTKGDMYGADVKSSFKLGNNWHFDLDMAYKNGTNFSYFDTLKVKPALKDIRISNFYAIPIIRHDFNLSGLKSIEFSNRYEYLTESNHYNPNPRQTFTPMLGFEFVEKYSAFFQIGAVIDAYKNNIPKTTTYSHNTMVAQLQLRF